MSCWKLGDVADKVKIHLRLSGETMTWVDVLHQLILILPLLIVAPDTADHSFQFFFLATRVGKWCQRGYREDGIKSFFKGLYLDFDGLVEGVVKNEVYVVLGVIEGYFLVFTSGDELYLFVLG